MARHRPRLRNNPRHERGFILIAAIWMLILSSAIVAVLMLRGMSRATDADAAGKALSRKLLAEGAVETVLADRLFNGVRSQWWLLPANGSVRIGTDAIQVRMSSESGRLDINEASLERIDRALMGLGVAAGQRRIILDRLGAYRGARRIVSSFEELSIALGGGPEASATCLGDVFTFSSGLSEPRKDSLLPRLASALGEPGSSIAQGQAEAGAALRIEAAGIDQIVRLADSIKTPNNVILYLVFMNYHHFSI